MKLVLDDSFQPREYSRVFKDTNLVMIGDLQVDKNIFMRSFFYISQSKMMTTIVGSLIAMINDIVTLGR